ncbi:STAS domain-containing protein [Micromonospora sp. WMMD1120]|uniref:STAS domain-containing protein n=1 Tax=Micromonospora sp. WMMD1120 TaxID=3016106 RepID=UPI002416AC3A|nr:STAS domain-containing protein [Micromonospora sp. WMMD1120]MDG4809809.1 STAS domain-containing protein [Micromonospora sp. WMMD1120]
MSFSVGYVERDGDGAALRLAGELDLSTAPELSAAIDRLFDAGETRVLLDLTDLTFCDSTGMAVFVRGDNRASADGGWLRLTGVHGRVERVLRVTGLADVLRYEPESVDPGAHSVP